MIFDHTGDRLKKVANKEREMEIDKLTLGEIKSITQLIQPKQDVRVPFEVGKNYFIRSVTHYYTGRLKEIVGSWLVLENAAWIADTGRFHDFLKDGKCNEYEAFVNDVNVPMGSIIDVTVWIHPLFKGQK